METCRFRRLRPVRPGRSLAVESCERRLVMSGTSLLPAYDTGSPDVVEIWVDPAAGNDAQSGTTRELAVRTVSEAWRRIPMGTTLSQGVRLNLTAGTYPQSGVPHFWESRHGTFTAPVPPGCRASTSSTAATSTSWASR